jgi:hypothetical protein
VFAINSMAVPRYRERQSGARAKSDHADAMTLANSLRVDTNLHRQLPAGSELAQGFIRRTCTTQGMDSGQLTIHADRGSSMTSKPVFLRLLLESRFGVSSRVLEEQNQDPHCSKKSPLASPEGGQVVALRRCQLLCPALWEPIYEVLGT